MAISDTYLTLILIATTTIIISSAAAAKKGGGTTMREACSVTRHPSLCIHSLAPFSSAGKQNPHWWARAAVSVTIAETDKVSRHLSRLLRSHRGHRGRARAALVDCVECFDEAVEQLRGSIRELRSLRRTTFDVQMGNVETWVSAALTYESTCLDGFGGRSAAAAAGIVRCGVVNATYFTGNALALVNKLAAARGGRKRA